MSMRKPGQKNNLKQNLTYHFIRIRSSPMTGERRSARANKGQHPKRELEASLEQERIEKELKKQKNEVKAKKLGDVSWDIQVTANDEIDDQKVNATESDDTSIVKCVPCGTTQENYDEATDTGGTFIQCDNCNTWQHAKCMGYKTAKAIPEHYECSECLKDSNFEQHDAAPPVLVGVELLRDQIHDETRLSTAKAFYTYFKKSFPESQSNESKEELASKWALQIERLIFTNYTSKKYIEEGRRILFLLKKHFMGDILANKLTFEELISKAPSEINRDIEQVELKVRSDIKNIILTRNEPSDIIRRTHKGDIIRENDVEEDYQEMVGITKKVDHRRFGDDTKVTPAGPISHNTQQTTASLNSYHNFNPRIEDDEEEEQQSEQDIDGKDDDEAEVEEAQPSVIPARKTKIAASAPHLPKVWSGKITFPQFAAFSSIASFYNSTDDNSTLARKLDICSDIFSYPSYFIEGKFDRQRADTYLDKLLGSRHIYLVQIKSNDSAEFDKMLQYLHQKRRVGVLSGKTWFVKDSYLLAIDFSKEVPSYLKPLKLETSTEKLGMYALFTVKKDYEPKHELEVDLPSPQATHSNQSGADLSAIMNQLRDSQAAS